jgi:hypothetical protein
MTEKIITPRLSKQSLQFHGYVKKWTKKLAVIKKKHSDEQILLF